MTYREEMAWAGGLFEGEGTIFTSKFHKHPTWTPRAHSKLVSTDRDTLERLQAALGGLGYLHGPYNNGLRKDGQPRKPFWQWSVVGFERVQAVVAFLWPWLGVRRREQARTCLAKAGPPQGRTRDSLGRWK